MLHHVNITISPVVGGFVVSYPVASPEGFPVQVTEVATSIGKAMRVAKAAVEAFSLVKKTADDAE